MDILDYLRYSNWLGFAMDVRTWLLCCALILLLRWRPG